MTLRSLLLSLGLLGLFIASADAEEDVDDEIRKATLVKLHDKAPDFTLRTTDGREFKLSAMRGKVVVLYFFASSAPFSFTEMRYLEKEVFQPLCKRDDFAILGIGRGHTREDVVRIGGENKLTFPLAADLHHECYRRYFSQFVPRLVVVDRGGIISQLRAGYREFDGIVDVQQAVAKALSVSSK